MKPIFSFSAKSVLLVLAVLLFSFSCKGRKDIVPSIEFAQYITAYTGGVVSCTSPIRIELSQEQSVVELNTALKDNPFKFTPSLRGKAYWISNNVIEFLPEEGALKPGELYHANFRLGDILKVEDKLSNFEFSFRVQQKNFSWSVDPIDISAQSDFVSVGGKIRFSDVVELEDVRKMLSVKTPSRAHGEPSISVEGGDNPHVFTFLCTNIVRGDEDYNLTIEVNGKRVDVKKNLEEEVLIPAKGKDMRLLGTRRIDLPENGIQIIFSNPVDELQDLNGLIEIPELSSYVYQIVNNRVNICFEPIDVAELTLNVHPGVLSSYQTALPTSHTISFAQISIKPAVEIVKAGAIIPDSKNLILPFRAVSLYAVDLKIIRIYESNILSFMQNNSLETNNDLRRSGRLVYRKTLKLNDDASKDLRQWNDYSIDLSGVIKQEPGAIYRIVLSFKQEYSAYQYAGSGEVKISDDSEQMVNIASESISEEENAEWDTYGYYQDSNDVDVDWELYDWEQRDNPCNPSYYMSYDRVAACNVIASNIGVIVKRNSAGNMWITTNNIIDTKPISNAVITAYNYQLQPIGNGTTDASGFAEIVSKGVPFIVVAESDGQKGYVKIFDGEEYSTSRFDVGGKTIMKGLKGFVYADRGVWRPGDTINVAFMLDDKAMRIPDNHPVVLELYNPMGQFYRKLISVNGVNGLYTFAVSTKADDPTGLWNAYVKIGGASFHKSLRVETVKPNRLKINLNIPEKVLKAYQGVINTKLVSSWLTGATASDLKVKIDMKLSKAGTQFKGYESYLFNDPATEFTTFTKEVFEGRLNGSGVADVTIKLPEAVSAAGMLRADITTRVFEPGGDASINTITLPYAPFESYVGIKLNQPKGKYIETDKDHIFQIVTLSTDGKPISRTGLEYNIYRIDWNWWWDNSNESIGNYINNNSVKPVESGRLNTPNGKGEISFKVDYPQWGRYLVYVKDPQSGHACGGSVYVDWPEWRGRSSKSDPSGIQMLTFSIDKESYNIGETVTAIIPASAGGRALVSIENGSTIIHREWVDVTEGKDTKYQFKTTDAMAPNVYLHIILLQPHSQSVNDLPIRMYGVVPVFITNKQTVLEPIISMPSVLRPQSEFAVTVSEKQGKPMTYTIAIVDDGLLDLTGFRTPDPWSEFYAREALGIRTWDMYDDVLGSYAGRYGSMFSVGGDEALKPSDAKANRFRPVVKFLGPFTVGKGKSKTHKITLPMYVGSVRTMVVAGQDGAYGNAEKTTPVRTPLMVLSTLPRVISIGEEILVPVNIFAMDGTVKNVSVSLSSSSSLLVPQGAAKQSLMFTQSGDKLLFFKMKAGNKVGKEVVNIVASGGGQSAKERIEIEVRNPNPPMVTYKNYVVEAGSRYETDYTFEAGSVQRSARIEVSRVPSVNLSGCMTFLYNYEHLCTEQITSKALPLLFVGAFREFDKAETEQMKSSVADAIKRLYSRQLPNGGFTYWPGSANADEWITSYAGMFLALAQEKGYSVNANVIAKWKRFQRSAAQNWRSEQDVKWLGESQQSFRLYTLSLAGAPELGAMNRMKEMKDLSQQSKWQLAAAYAVNGKAKAAGELLANAKDYVVPYSSNNRIYATYDRDEAMMLETLVLLGRNSEAMAQAKKVSNNLTVMQNYNTQSTAFALMSMGRLADKLSGSLTFDWGVGSAVQPAVKSSKVMFTKGLTANGSKVWVKNNSTGVLCVDIITSQSVLNDLSPAVARGLNLNVNYSNLKGESVNVSKLKQGSDFVASVTVSNIGNDDYSNLALTHIIPSGWEIYNERLIAGEENASTYTYQDIRDDRVLTYFDLRRGEYKQFTIRLQATYAGHFVLPAIKCEAMYDDYVFARTQAGIAEVER